VSSRVFADVRALTLYPSSTDRSEVELWIRRLWGVHGHGVEVRPRETSHPVSFESDTGVQLYHVRQTDAW